MHIIVADYHFRGEEFARRQGWKHGEYRVVTTVDGLKGLRFTHYLVVGYEHQPRVVEEAELVKQKTLHNAAHKRA